MLTCIFFTPLTQFGVAFIRNKYVKRGLLISVPFFCCSISSYSQPDKILNYEKTQLHLDYRKPVGFKEQYPDTSYFPGSYFQSSPLIYEIHSPINNITISVGIIDFPPIIDIYKKNKLRHPTSAFIPPDFNTDYERSPSPVADTTNDKIVHFNRMYAKSLWNADGAIEYKVDMKKFKVAPYKKEYHNCKILIIHKDNWADITLYYWYTDQSSYLIDSVIEKTKGMFRFKNRN